jgi:hypothetical protein
LIADLSNSSFNREQLKKEKGVRFEPGPKKEEDEKSRRNTN